MLATYIVHLMTAPIGELLDEVMRSREVMPPPT